MPDPASLTDLGLVGLFVAAFLAGSILPFASEVVLLGVMTLGASVVSVVSVATAGNVLGALSIYGIGRLFAGRKRDGDSLTDRLMARVVAEDPTRLSRAKERVARWGPLALLAAWVPLLGDALVLAAGLLALPFWPVTLYTTVGKAARYLALAGAVVAAS